MLGHPARCGGPRGARRAVCVQVWYGDWFLRRAVSWSVCLQVSRHQVGRSDSRACLVMCSSVRSSRRAMPVSGVAIGPCAGWSVGCRCAGRSVQVRGLGHGCRRSTRVTPARLSAVSSRPSALARWSARRGLDSRSVGPPRWLAWPRTGCPALICSAHRS